MLLRPQPLVFGKNRSTRPSFEMNSSMLLHGGIETAKQISRVRGSPVRIFKLAKQGVSTCYVRDLVTSPDISWK